MVEDAPMLHRIVAFLVPRPILYFGTFFGSIFAVIILCAIIFGVKIPDPTPPPSKEEQEQAERMETAKECVEFIRKYHWHGSVAQCIAFRDAEAQEDADDAPDPPDHTE